MSVRREITEYSAMYFITITCCRWLHLFEEADAYDVVYQWFDILKRQGHFICAYVIMPNHLHCLIAFRNTQGQSINGIVGNGKRFMAYGIVKRLKVRRNDVLLNKIKLFVDKKEKLKGKIHEVFQPSFDWKDCESTKFVEQKVNYIHDNPCQEKWKLVELPENYLHSSASFYSSGQLGRYDVTSYAQLEDIDLTKPWIFES